MRWLLLCLLCACGKRAEPKKTAAPARVTIDQSAAPCAHTTDTRQLLWGDLHVHTAYSFDARSYGTIATPADAYRFAKGEPVVLHEGAPPRTIPRPLDFVGLSDHGEFFGEVALCFDKTQPAYGLEVCQRMHTGDGGGAFAFGTLLSIEPARLADVCGIDGRRCKKAAAARWKSYIDAAEAAYDRTSRCTFSSLIGYEYTNTHNVSNLHRNVFFDGKTVPAAPISYFEAPTPASLWRALDQQCTGDCQPLVIPHNANLSNGKLFEPTHRKLSGKAATQAASLRARMEPLVEIHQHKGSGECRDGLGQGNGDPLCAFEKLRGEDTKICGDAPGQGGMRLWGCLHRLDFVRDVLLEGLVDNAQLGINTYRLGFVGATDTHNGTPGAVSSSDYRGHVGSSDNTADKRLANVTTTHDSYIYNPGGLTAVWAKENRRQAIFSALLRRETYATSGQRISVRTFAGYNLPNNLCESRNIAAAYQSGTTMGGTVKYEPGKPLRIWIDAARDPDRNDGADLAAIQLIKGYVDPSGAIRSEVIDIKRAAFAPPSSCATVSGAPRLCAYYEDPNPVANAFYYARVVAVPTCRWSKRQCTKRSHLPGCQLPDHVQHMAWTSPIWLEK